MKRIFRLLLLITGITMTVFFFLHTLTAPNDHKKIWNAFDKTASALSLSSTSVLQSNTLEKIINHEELSQTLSVSLQSIESGEESYQYLDDLSSLQFHMTSTASDSSANGTYALQYSAMPLIDGSYECQSQLDTLSITSPDLWKGSIELPIKNFGTDYQASSLRSFFPSVSIPDSTSLTPLTEIILHPFASIAIASLSDVSKAFQSCQISEKTDLKSNPLSADIAPTDLQVQTYDLLLSDEILTLLPKSLVSELLPDTPITISIDSDGYIRYVSVYLLKDRILSFSVIDIPQAACHVSLESTVPEHNVNSIEADFIVSCRQQQFQITVSSLTLNQPISDKIDSGNHVTITLKGEYTLSLPSDDHESSSFQMDPQYPVLQMNHEELQQLENEIWNSIYEDPKLKMFFFSPS